MCRRSKKVAAGGDNSMLVGRLTMLATLVTAGAAVAGVIFAHKAVESAEIIGDRQIKITKMQSQIAGRGMYLATIQTVSDFRSLLLTSGEEIEECAVGPGQQKSFRRIASRANIDHVVNLVLADPWLASKYLAALVYDEDPAVAAGSLVVVGHALERLHRAKTGVEQKSHRQIIESVVVPEKVPIAFDVSGVYISDANLSHLARVADFGGAILQGVCLARVRWDRAVLSGADLRGAIVIESSFTGANLEASLWEGAVVRETDFSKADFRGAVMGDADFSEGHPSDTRRFSFNVLNGVDLRDAVLSGSDLEGVRLCDSVLKNARVGKTNFRRALMGTPGSGCEQVQRPSLYDQGVRYPDHALL